LKIPTPDQILLIIINYTIIIEVIQEKINIALCEITISAKIALTKLKSAKFALLLDNKVQM
jgi:hypothetical protein